MVAGVIVLLIWLVSWYLPQGKTLSKYDAQKANLLSQEASLQARLLALQKLHNSNLCNLHEQYDALVPPVVENTGYLRELNATVTQAGVHLNSVTLGNPGAGGTGGLASIPITLNTTGTYDAELQLMNLIYALPRLTTITSLNISGGQAPRNSPLQITYNLQIFDTAPAVNPAVPTTTTTVPKCGPSSP